MIFCRVFISKIKLYWHLTSYQNSSFDEIYFWKSSLSPFSIKKILSFLSNFPVFLFIAKFKFIPGKKNILSASSVALSPFSPRITYVLHFSLLWTELFPEFYHCFPFPPTFLYFSKNMFTFPYFYYISAAISQETRQDSKNRFAYNWQHFQTFCPLKKSILGLYSILSERMIQPERDIKAVLLNGPINFHFFSRHTSSCHSIAPHYGYKWLLLLLLPVSPKSLLDAFWQFYYLYNWLFI